MPLWNTVLAIFLDQMFLITSSDYQFHWIEVFHLAKVQKTIKIIYHPR